MNTFYRRYFKISSPEVLAGVQALRGRTDAMREQANVLAHQYGFEHSATRNDTFGGFRLVGFATPRGEVPKGFRVAAKLRTEDGHDVYVPDRKYKLGKEVEKVLRGVPSVFINSELLEVAGCESIKDVHTSGRLNFATAAIKPGHRDTLLVSLPFDDIDAPVPPYLLEHGVELTPHAYEAEFQRA